MKKTKPSSNKYVYINTEWFVWQVHIHSYSDNNKLTTLFLCIIINIQTFS